VGCSKKSFENLVEAEVEKMMEMGAHEESSDLYKLGSLGNQVK
jgi:hypothetical protein